MDLQRELKSITRGSKHIFGLDQNIFCLGCSDTPMAHEGLMTLSKHGKHVSEELSKRSELSK